MARIHGVVKHVGGRVGLVWLALALVALDACRSDAGVQPDPDPDPEPEAPPALVLRMEGDTTFSGMAGTTVTVSVRVEDEDGVAHAGILLRGAVTRGEGTVDPSEIRSGEDGGATLQWTFGEGDNDVRVWVDSLPDLETFAHATGLPRVGALRVTVHRYGNADDPDGFLVSALEGRAGGR